MMEQQCRSQTVSDAKISGLIKDLYLNTISQVVFPPTATEPLLYDYKNPLILSLENLTKTYESLKDNPSANVLEISTLYNNSRRYEGLKCSFEYMKEKQKNDIRPYLNFFNYCQNKFQNEMCEEREYTKMNGENAQWTKDNAIGLCKSFSKNINCEAEYGINQRNNTIGVMVERYYKRFKNERFANLFKLRSDHQKYNCEKTNDDKTIMNIKVLDSSFSHQWLVELLRHVEETWSHKNFSLKLELVTKYSDGVVTLIPTNKGISYVPENNSRIVYLSSAYDPGATKKILAHEFGHILGFPDCYIEFFDDSKKELVYYEISKNNTNIMCSLKDDVQVEEDYFLQLAQNSCLFN